MKMLRAGFSGRLPRKLRVHAGEGCSRKTRVSISTGSPLSRFTVHAAAAIAILLLTAACDKPAVVVTSVDTFCTRVERYHATDAERAFLKANSGPLERLIRWVAGINGQYDSNCLQPAKGA